MKFLALLGLAAAPALAQNAAPGPICTDRPTKSNFACTVPASAIQIETDTPSWTRYTLDGTRTNTVLPINPVVKLGLGSHTDVEVNWAPYVSLRSHASAGGTNRLHGIGDLTLRVKQRLTTDGAEVQIALIPFVKAPTAKSGIGNGQWEGGTILAANVPLPGGFLLTLDPEADVLADADGRGHHASLTGVLNLSHAVGKALTVYGELWTQRNMDPAGTLRQHSADVAVAWLIAATWQIDAGANFGLDRRTPQTQVYLGLSTRL